MIWTAIKDIALTGAGLYIILSQVQSPTPSDLLLATGLALTVPSVASNAKILLTHGNSGSAPPSSRSTPPSGSSSSGSSSGEADDE